MHLFLLDGAHCRRRVDNKDRISSIFDVLSLLQQMIESPLVTAMSQAFSAFVIIFLFD